MRPIVSGACSPARRREAAVRSVRRAPSTPREQALEPQARRGRLCDAKPTNKRALLRRDTGLDGAHLPQLVEAFGVDEEHDVPAREAHGAVHPRPLAAEEAATDGLVIEVRIALGAEPGQGGERLSATIRTPSGMLVVHGATVSHDRSGVAPCTARSLRAEVSSLGKRDRAAACLLGHRSPRHPGRRRRSRRQDRARRGRARAACRHRAPGRGFGRASSRSSRCARRPPRCRRASARRAHEPREVALRGFCRTSGLHPAVTAR